MNPMFSTDELEAFLDETLPIDRMTAIEEALRGDASLGERLGEVIGRRDAGLHTIGAIWRRNRLSCPSREELGSFLLGILDDATAAYIRFHLEKVACRYCTANVDDLQAQQDAAESARADSRRTRYFQSSAGLLSSDKN